MPPIIEELDYNSADLSDVIPPDYVTEANHDSVTDYDFDLPDVIPPDYERPKVDNDLSQMAFMYLIAISAMLLTWIFVFFCLRMMALRQKTQNPQERRMYAGARPRPASFPAQEPTIYVSPAHNLPPPPKYECMAPPSYEEVVGVHYPHLQQPITQPITTAIRTESDRTNATGSTTTISSSTVVTVSADDRRTSVTVAASA
ncbi:hypothetical protein O0L34_g1857 [Tuta absoluta]|nr:hypothetical protein O0L34_g1857 [Tuta absoluta]